MPDVPNLPGVPALTSFSAAVIALLTADLVPPIVGAAAPRWGVFLDGVNVIDAESVIDFELKQDNPISTYPVEQGAFVSYDKVQMPTEIRVRFAQGGSLTDRQNFLDSIDAVMNTTDLYDVVTPEATYLSYNFIHRDFRRTSKAGLGLIVVDLWLEEVRVTSAATFTNTQSPTVSGQQGNGTAQPSAPSAAVQQNFDSGAWGYL
jgi:hypothetical protein